MTEPRRNPYDPVRVHPTGPEVPTGLRFAYGSEAGRTFNVRFAGQASEDSGGQTLVSWHRVGVRTIEKRPDGSKAIDFWKLVPGDPDAPKRILELGPFYVCGRFSVVEHGTGKLGNELWREFEAE